MPIIIIKKIIKCLNSPIKSNMYKKTRSSKTLRVRIKIKEIITNATAITNHIPKD